MHEGQFPKNISSVKPNRVEKVLIANRGEIAVRILKTAHRLGIRSVAVYSDADRDALHVRLAQEAYRIGEPAPSASYLNAERVLDVARQSGADALHPGYGFLSENYNFADDCSKAGIKFIGPPSSAIRDMGIKSTSKQLMQNAGVPVIPGYHGANQDDQLLLEEAKKIEFPVMIKATHGGGGKGMRVAKFEAEFLEQLNSARNESRKAFGNTDVLLEKFIRRPRHVEVQVFGDQHGNCVYLFERDCSVQRRHQKIIEEAPAPGISEQVRKQLGEAAVRAAKAVNYVGAGTVEFILDTNDNEKFYFMEMNTRLQVEHPITEMITNLDLVEWQFRVASGEPLPMLQTQLSFRGHSFEARVYAEDPENGFMPCAGKIQLLKPPPLGENVRLEIGIEANSEVPVFYDPMIAKLVVWGKDRTSALSKLREQLGQFVITGITTNIDFLLRLASERDFIRGDVYTDFIPDHQDQLFPEVKPLPAEQVAKFVVGLLMNEDEQSAKEFNQVTGMPKRTAFRIANVGQPVYKFPLKDEQSGHEYQIQVQANPDDYYDIWVDDQKLINVQGQKLKEDQGQNWLISFDHQKKFRFGFVRDGELLVLSDGDRVHRLTRPIPSYLNLEAANEEFANRIKSPMPGIIERLMFKEGDQVKAGEQILVMIAMKMEYVIKASRDCTIKRIYHDAGNFVAKGEVLLELEEETSE